MEKVKYIEYLAPMTKLVKGAFYGADGNLVSYDVQQRCDLGFQNLVDQDSKLRQPLCSITEKFDYNNNTYTLCKERERNLDDSWYIRGGEAVSRGFGDLDIFSTIKFGEGTRMLQQTIRDNENDRLYNTNRNYAVQGNFEYPVDTRVANKKYSFAFGN